MLVQFVSNELVICVTYSIGTLRKRIGREPLRTAQNAGLSHPVPSVGPLVRPSHGEEVRRHVHRL